MGLRPENQQNKNNLKKVNKIANSSVYSRLKSY